jgi:hypothetical protein
LFMISKKKREEEKIESLIPVFLDW